MTWNSLGTLSAREEAVLVWSAILILVVLSKPSWRRAAVPAALDVLRAMLVWRIVAVFGLFLVYIAGLIWLGSWTSAWNPSLTKDTVLIVVGASLPLLSKGIVSIEDGGKLFKHFIQETVGATAVVVYVAGLASYALWIELLLLPVAVFATALNAFASRREDGRAASMVSSFVLIVLGIAAIVWSVSSLLRGASGLEFGAEMRSFTLTIWLPLGTLPFVYATGYLTAYGRVLALVHASSGIRASWQVRIALLLGFRGRLGAVKGFHPYTSGVRGDSSFREVLHVAIGSPPAHR
ncbi:hypothetical protein [Curtobacterium sp. PhB137]|uniref:hypothetical protein n=1 Tax=Curtobacterium sp. PhB137 TaxID=2485182 RepID=UPI000F4F9788|nr:hypothetical protein [Curtobacterium sp. PhB137]